MFLLKFRKQLSPIQISTGFNWSRFKFHRLGGSVWWKFSFVLRYLFTSGFLLLFKNMFGQLAVMFFLNFNNFLRFKSSLFHACISAQNSKNGDLWKTLIWGSTWNSFKLWFPSMEREYFFLLNMFYFKKIERQVIKIQQSKMGIVLSTLISLYLPYWNCFPNMKMMFPTLFFWVFTKDID